MTPELDLGGSPLTPKSPSVLFPKTPIDPEVPPLGAIEEVQQDEHSDTRYTDSPAVLGADHTYPYAPHGHDNAGERSEKYLPSHAYAPGPGRNRERDIDPFTVFVGGLDTVGMNAWDEERLQNVFGQYGHIEDIKVVRPSESHRRLFYVLHRLMYMPEQ